MEIKWSKLSNLWLINTLTGVKDIKSPVILETAQVSDLGYHLNVNVIIQFPKINDENLKILTNQIEKK